MLLADVSHKILNSQTVLDVMYEEYQRCRGGNYKEVIAKKVIGQIVLTRLLPLSCAVLVDFL